MIYIADMHPGKENVIQSFARGKKYIHYLGKNQPITIKPADKWGGVGMDTNKC